MNANLKNSSQKQLTADQLKLNKRMYAQRHLKPQKENVFQASELELLDMSGLYAENIQNARINKYGQMVYAACPSHASSLHQNASCSSLATSNRPPANNPASAVARLSG